MRRCLAILAIVMMGVTVVAACGDDADVPGNADVNTSVPVSAATVKIKSSGFDPSSATVPAGQAVTFTNDDNQDHRVVADDSSFDTGTIRPGESTVVLFQKAGTVPYKDTLDPSNTGQIEVTAS